MGLLAPNVLFQSRKVDVRVAVALYAVYLIVTGCFFFADRVFRSPTQQHVECPLGKTRIAFAVQHVAVPSGYPGFVTGDHIEIGACEISFVFISRFEHDVAVAADGAFPEFAESSVRFVFLAIGFTKRVVSSLVVHISVCGVQVE